MCSTVYSQFWIARSLYRRLNGLLYSQNNASACLCQELGTSFLHACLHRMHHCSKAKAMPEVVEMCRNAQVGVPCSRACSACHTSMSVHFQAALFVAAAPSHAGGKPGGKPSRPRQRTGNPARADPALVVGQPLPHMGTCKHYHHSHR